MPTETNEGYELTDAERNQVAVVQQQVLLAKSRVYDLNVQREQLAAEIAKAIDALDAAQNQWTAILGFVAGAHGMTAARLTEDLRRIVPREE